MEFIKINGHDYSQFCNSLKITKSHKYNAQENAAGNTVVDYINSKRTVEVGIIPLDAAAMETLQADIDNLVVSLTFLNPNTKVIEENVQCLISGNAVEYYTIQNSKTMFKAFSLTFNEL